MRSKILQEILDETPKEVEEFVMKYGDSLVNNYQKEIIIQNNLTTEEHFNEIFSFVNKLIIYQQSN